MKQHPLSPKLPPLPDPPFIVLYTQLPLPGLLGGKTIYTFKASQQGPVMAGDPAGGHPKTADTGNKKPA